MAKKITLKDYSRFHDDRVVCKRLAKDTKIQMREDGFDQSVIDTFHDEAWNLRSVDEIIAVIGQHYVIE